MFYLSLPTCLMFDSAHARQVRSSSTLAAAAEEDGYLTCNA